jgi:phytoene synthase
LPPNAPSAAGDPAIYCADLVRRLDHDRYLCTLFAPTELRPYLFALYAFNVEIALVREQVSEPFLGQMRLQWWRETLADMAAGQIRQHPVAIALAAAIDACRLPGDAFERIVVARESDLDDAPPADIAALEAYAEGTSGILARLATAVLGAREPQVGEAARHVGISWALVGLLRAVPFHASQRRLYLPRDLLARAGVEPESIFEGKPGAGLSEIVREIAEHATQHLICARALRRDVPRAALPALLPATLAELYLRRLARVGYAPFAPALHRPSGMRALRLTLASLLGRY